MTRRADFLGRIQAKLVQEDRGYSSPCWVWLGKIRPDGYGVIRLNKQDTRSILMLPDPN